MHEEWRAVPSWPGIEASSLGRIRRRPYTREMPNGGLRVYEGRPTYGVRAASTGLAGFRMIYRYSSLGKTFKIHRLVCEAFHGAPPFAGAVVMHLDDDPSNNRPDNLKWATQKENLNAQQFLAYARGACRAKFTRSPMGK